MEKNRMFSEYLEKGFLVKEKIELWDLYNKNIYIKVKTQTINNLFDYFIESVKDKQGFIIKNIWFYRKGIYFTPLNLIIKILNLFPVEEKTKFKKLIEVNLEELKFGYGLAKSIKNPKLPIKLSPRLARVCGHLIGDGGIRLRKGDYAVHYTNKDPFLINQFKKDIQNIFGGVDPYKYDYNVKNNKNLKVIRFPSIIGILLMEFFGPLIKDTKDIPNTIINANKKYKNLFLRALFDDEGCISSNRIVIEMSSKKILEKIKKMLETDFLIYPTGIFKRDNKKHKSSYRIEIHGRKDIIRFSKKIGFSHLIKKKKLGIYVKDYKNKQVRFRKGELKNLIIDILKKENNLSVYNISDKLNILPKRSFRKHLYSLEKKNIIQAMRNKNKIKIYSIK